MSPYMPELPLLTGKKVISILPGMGFSVERIIGSHHVLVKGDLTVVVPVNGNKDLPKGTLMAILKQAEI